MTQYSGEEIESILTNNGMNFRKIEDEITVQFCPFCHSGVEDITNQFKCNINSNKLVYNCFRCGAKGKWVDFVDRIGDHENSDSTATSKKIDKIWSETIRIEDARSAASRTYFSRRGIVFAIPTAIRFHPSLHYKDGVAGESHGQLPAIVCEIVNENGARTGLHRIYLSTDGSKAPVQTPKKAIGKIKGCAIRFGVSTDELHVAEGVETALSVYQVLNRPTWSAISAGGLECILIPHSVGVVHIWADKDRSETGQLVAHKLAIKLFAEGKVVFVHLPKGDISDGQKSIDWNDILLADPGAIQNEYEKCKPWTPAAPIRLDQNSKWPEPLAEEAFHGIVGQITKAIFPETESDIVALVFQFLCVIGNLVGRTCYYQVEKTKHHLNIFVTLVGKTSRARKGTSLDHALAIVNELVPDWTQNCLASGLSSGEGLIMRVRDRVDREINKKNKATGNFETETITDDEGVSDKRLLLTESEFSKVLQVSAREGNTLSAILRDAWDSTRPLCTLTKNPFKATNHHISIIGHITFSDLKERLSEADAFNGMGNRFLWPCVQRSKRLPDGGNIQNVNLKPFQDHIARAIQFAQQSGRIEMSQEARGLWHLIYYNIADNESDSLADAMLARAEAQMIRLACLYAILDLSSSIEVVHLKAALALWDYCDASCRFIFGETLGDDAANRILSALRESPDGKTRTEIRALFANKMEASRIEKALLVLSNNHLAVCQTEATQGRPIERWFAIKAKRQ